MTTKTKKPLKLVKKTSTNVKKSCPSCEKKQTKKTVKKTSKKEYQSFLEKQLKEREAKIDILKIKAEKLQKEIDKKYHVTEKKDLAIKKISELKNNIVELVSDKKEMKKRLNKLKKSGEDMRENMKEGVEDVAEFLEEKIKKIFKKHD